MKLGIQVSSFRPVLKNQAQLRTACGRMREMGCSLVQLQWIDPGIPPRIVADALREAELQSVSVQDFYTEVEKNGAYYTTLNTLTGGTWVCVSRIPEDRKTMEGLHKYASELRAMAHALEQSGQKLCFHPVNGISPAEQLLAILPELNICADLYHLHKSGRNLCQWLTRYAGRVCMVHFKDFITHPDGTEELVPAGQGEIDWTNVAETCLKTGVEYGFVEQERWQGDPFERLEEAFRWLIREADDLPPV